MEREYLFRGKRIKEEDPLQRWIEGSYINYVNYKDERQIRIVSSNGYHNRVEIETICQFIGLTDKNGTKIFDGDIISVNGVVSFAVKYIEERLSFCLANTNELKLNLKCMSPWNPVSASWWNEFGKEIEVIGNIHDNPELIK